MAGRWPGRRWLVAQLALIGTAGLGLWIWGGKLAALLARWGAPRLLVRPRGPEVPRFYARALRLLARRDLRPRPGETARQFSRRAGTALPAARAPLEQLTRHYERARFGGRALAPGELEDAERLLTEIDAR